MGTSVGVQTLQREGEAYTMLGTACTGVRRARMVGKAETCTHHGLWQALMLVAPDDEVQEVGQVVLADGILAPQPVRNPVLVQHKHIEPVALALGPAHPSMRQQQSMLCTTG